MSTSNTFRPRVSSDRLILANEQFSERTLALYAELDEAERIRVAFLDDPASVIRERIFTGMEMSIAAGDNRANRFLFALLGSSRFHRWIAEYQDDILRQLRAARAQLTPKDGMRLAVRLLDRRQRLQDFTEGLKTYGEERIYRALLPPAVALEDYPGRSDLSIEPLIISHDMLARQVSASLDGMFGTAPNGSEANDKPALASRLTDEQLFALYDLFYRSAPQPKASAGAGAAAQAAYDDRQLAFVVRPSRVLLRQFATILTQQMVVCVERLRRSRELSGGCAAGEKQMMSGGGR